MYKIKKTTFLGLFISFFGFLTAVGMQPGTTSMQQDDKGIYFSDSDGESENEHGTRYYNQTPKNDNSEQDPDLIALANTINQQQYKKKNSIHPLCERPASISSPIPMHIHVSESPKPENNDRRNDAYFKPIKPDSLKPHRTASVPTNIYQMAQVARAQYIARTESEQALANRPSNGSQSPLARITSFFKNKK